MVVHVAGVRVLHLQVHLLLAAVEAGLLLMLLLVAMVLIIVVIIIPVRVVIAPGHLFSFFEL